MDPAQLWSSLPAVITVWDGKKATVRPLIKMRYVDGSQTDFPTIENVQVITPSTAFAGIKLPIRVGDKVVLHIQDRDIQRLLFVTDTSGLDVLGGTPSDHARLHDLTDAIAYAGFGSLNAIVEADLDVWMFNNKDSDSDSYNHVRFKATGDIEHKTLRATSVMYKNGDITAQNSACNLSMQDAGNISLKNPKSSLEIDAGGTVTVTASATSITMLPTGVTTIDSSTEVTVKTGIATFSGDVSISGELTVGGNITGAGNITAAATMSASGVGGALIHPS